MLSKKAFYRKRGMKNQEINNLEEFYNRLLLLNITNLEDISRKDNTIIFANVEIILHLKLYHQLS